MWWREGCAGWRWWLWCMCLLLCARCACRRCLSSRMSCPGLRFWSHTLGTSRRILTFSESMVSPPGLRDACRGLAQRTCLRATGARTRSPLCPASILARPAKHTGQPRAPAAHDAQLQLSSASPRLRDIIRDPRKRYVRPYLRPAQAVCETI